MRTLQAARAGWFIAALFLSACVSATPDCASKDVFCVGLVTNIGKINDKSFNQSAWEGGVQSQRELGSQVQYIETVDPKDYDKNIATFADENYDVIVTVGFSMSEATLKAAGLYPKVNFIGVDQFQDEEIPNVTGLIFPEDQAGFLVGALAAMMSKTHQIGAVCGPDVIPPIWRFGEGYRAGAAYADSLQSAATKVLIAYHENNDIAFTDVEWGAETAKSMMDQGVDVIFGCGGVTGNSAITTAAGAGAYVIGVDTDQYLTLPEAAPRMLSSAMKLITPGVLNLIRLAREGNFPGGNHLGEAGYAPYHDLESEVPADVKEIMEEIKAGLFDGSLETGVPSTKP
ncbi:MAG: BMP family ABC transporter substrate-binding protein [Anaerolineales bacterium]|nr:BMP family ABC transporter substrate-binding protein [Anaerolineales bacterium]